ncbi:Stk1 family PASTA domain-containing Ser/Thr kinase [Agilicoccus flavus]|uniref:Stk1 family PASTA domain-containing Ser/Thr kinase n=1 Tax=Agilicoccus flavus TaxID=2775968 RepID=UPI0021F522EA
MLAGRYEIGELIGRGGMAEVHAGYDTRLGREVAIKILRSELARDRSFLMRFRREAKSAASLNHPSIVAVFDSGEDVFTESGGAPISVPFIVMEYVHGPTLRDVLHEDGALEPMRATRIMTQVLRALHYSHAHGIIHRDVKPANVILGDGDEAKVMDFGIARAIADTAATMTNTSIVVGTAQYLSPEQAQGQDVDARSDLYSAGCLLYELLTGRPPFVGDSPVAIAYQHVGEPPQPPSVHAPAVPSNLDVVVLHALAKDPANRYADGEDFAADLDAVLRREPTRAAARAVAAGELAPAPAANPAPAVATGATALRITDEEPRRRRFPLVPVLVAVLAVAALVLGLLANRGVFDRPPAPVAVPGVVGQNQTAAKSALTTAGFAVATQNVKNRAAAGTVVTQNPTAGASSAPGSEVRLGVSTGPGRVEVPNLRNYQQETANVQLENHGLTVGGVRPVDSFEVPAGAVVSTAPKAGSKVAEGTPVTLLVSTGLVQMPDVTGMSQTQAAAALNKIALRYTPTLVDDARRKPGTVIEQSYAKGQKVPIGTVVDLNVVRPRASTPTATVTVTQSPTTSSGSSGTPRPTTPRSTDEPTPVTPPTTSNGTTVTE